jgi:hypothetical protein
LSASRSSIRATLPEPFLSPAQARPMANPADSAQIVRFGEFELDLRTGELRTNGQRLILQ